MVLAEEMLQVMALGVVVDMVAKVGLDVLMALILRVV